ncbi:MAG TPA: TIGR04283 family arsenosugar biosynthesis glycosyltransferase [Verrucomicrobiae bacterium]|nr:TIGR04283 family arsenosugar biosynthesis glycosyltransferase [Verrucomicrobiae bacterium]
MLISIIIPTLDEEVSLPVTLRQLADHPDAELIVVDGGSTDRTVEVAQQFTSYVFVSRPGCARQMNVGARHATGDILLFLHADTFLLPGALDEIQRRIIGDGAVGGAFDLHVDSGRRLCQIAARLTSHRARWLRLPCGDQGIFVWRQVFGALGGFPEVPIMEDVSFVRRLRRAGRLTFLPFGLVTSGRRWNANGVIRTMLVNWWVTTLFVLGMPPRQLCHIRDGWLVSGKVHREPGQRVSARRNSLQEGRSPRQLNAD